MLTLASEPAPAGNLRERAMKTFQKFALVAVLVLVSAGQAMAGVLHFDDLAGGDFSGPVPINYAGFTFNGWSFINAVDAPYPYASAPIIVYNAEDPYTNTPEILFGSRYNVKSVYLSDFNSGGSLTLRGFSGATEIYTSVLGIGQSMTKFDLNFMGIDRFVMETPQGMTFAFLDDLEIEPAPEPGSLALMCLGLLCVALHARRLRSVTCR